jgi:cytosol aminopeptidase
VNVEVRNMDWIESQKMTSFMAVAKSSCEPPIFLEMSYCGEQRDEKPILLIGSGLTFNSGGLMIKPASRMSEYRGAMAGAACVVATMRAVAGLSLPINVVGVVPLCENMPSGMSFKPGDVITALNGKTIAVHVCSFLFVTVQFP